MHLSKFLALLERLLRGEPPLNAFQRILVYFLSSVASWVAMVLFFALLVLGFARIRSIAIASATIDMCCGMFSCIAAQAWLHRTCRINKFMVTQHSTIGSTIACSHVVLMCLLGPTDLMWPMPPYYAAAALQVFSCVVGCAVGFFMTMMVGCVIFSLAGLCQALAELFGEARSSQEVGQAVRLYQRFQHQAHTTELLYLDMLLPMFTTALTSPFTSTIDFMTGTLGPITFASGPLIVSVFLLTALGSQDLFDASEMVGRKAYIAAFEAERRNKSEDMSVRKTLLLTMLVSGQGAQLSLRGFGPLTLKAAGNALRSWYSVVSMLLGSSK